MHQASARSTAFQVLPIAYPDPEELERARQRREAAERTRQERIAAHELRMAQAITAATQNGRDAGHTDGFREGFKSGTHWGMLCGVIATVLVGGLGVVFITQLIGMGRI